MRLDYFEPIAGDDRPIWTIHYRDVPEPFRLADAWTVLTDHLPLMQSRKSDLITAFDLHYGRYEINADTYQDFLDLLKETLIINADTMERLLSFRTDGYGTVDLFDEASENNFVCPFCQGSLEYMENAKVVEAIERQITDLKACV